MPATRKPRYDRAPDGVVTGRPILMRLLPAERDALVRKAKASNQSLSSFARRMTLLGLQQQAGSESHMTQDVPHND